MPAPTFAVLILIVITTAGLSIAAVFAAGISPLWFGLGAMTLTALVRGFAWR